MSVIRNRANPKVKEIRSLLQRKHRDRTRLFLLEGWRLVGQALEESVEIVRLVVAPELLTGDLAMAAQRLIGRSGAAVVEVAPEVLLSISPQHGHQGVVAVARQRWGRLEEMAPGADDCYVAVKEIREPWSIGTILRTCEAVGGRGMILVGESTDPYHPVAVRASLGTVFLQCLVKAGLGELGVWARRHGVCVVGTSPAGEADYREGVYRRPLVLFVGSERVGLSAEDEALCDVMVRIPMVGRCESHHVAVATGVVLYEIFNERRGDWGGGVEKAPRVWKQ